VSDIEAIHALTGRLGAAWAAGDGSEPSPGQDSTQTTVLVKNDGRWLVTAFQNSRKSR
jgi:hypothetical protein